LSKKIAVIGIGNTLRRDDGIGIRVLESLLKFYKKEGVDYFNFGIASFDLIHRIKNYDLILLIDGINANLPPSCAEEQSISPGELKIFELENAEYPFGSSLTSTHELNLKNIFKLAQNFGFKTKIYVAGIQVRDTSFGESLNDALNNKKEEIAKKISIFIDGMFS
jgi:hydrogenase maturation protease